MILRVLQSVFGESWKKYSAYVLSVVVLCMRDEVGLVRSDELDATSLWVFSIISAAYLVGQGLADFMKAWAPKDGS